MPAYRRDNDAAILFIETSGCLPMCGHGTIGIVTFGLEHGLITPAHRRTPERRGAGRGHRDRLHDATATT